MSCFFSLRPANLFLLLVMVFACGWSQLTIEVQACQSQTKTIIVSGDQILSQMKEVEFEGVSESEKESDDSAKAEKPKNEKSFDQLRLAALLKAKIDRSQPAVLKAWSNPPTEESESKKQAALEAKVANLFEDFIVLVAEKPASDFKKDDKLDLLVDMKQVGTLTVLSIDDKKVTGKIKPTDPDVELSVKSGQDVKIQKPKKTDAKAVEAAKIKRETAQWSRMIALGQWEEMKDYLGELKPEDGDKVYAHLLGKLGEIPGAKKSNSSSQPKGPPNFLKPDDLLAIAAAAPKPWENSFSESSHISKFAPLVAKLKTNGFDVAGFTESIKAGVAGIGGEEKEQKLVAADLFLQAKFMDQVEPFLPELSEAVKDKDIPALKLWSKLALRKFKTKKVTQWLDRAWEANITLSNCEKCTDKDKTTVMTNLIELAPKMDGDVGQKWLDDSFITSPERGMKILASLGARSSNMAHTSTSAASGKRLETLRLQNGAVEKLLAASPELAEKWSDALTLLADTWLKESEMSIVGTSRNNSNGYWDQDNYGNAFFVNDRSSSSGSSTGISEILEIAPSETWRSQISPSLKIRFNKQMARLNMHINNEEKSFVWIEKVAALHPDEAKSLVHEFLRIWIKNHDPNSKKRRRSSYLYSYGYNQRAEGIPLTRSKQQRNLRQLRTWIDRVRELKIEDVDEALLAQAFTNCHSSAEVYDLNQVKAVFGELSALKPKTIAAICQTMRSNLASNWRDVKNQEANKTKRRAPEVLSEVRRGYRVAMTLANEALASEPDNWQLHKALACLMFDENDFLKTILNSSEFSSRRNAALKQFKVAAEKYAIKAPQLEKGEQTTAAFDQWFYAALGATEVGKISNKNSPDPKQYPLIREAILSLPGTLGESHMSDFANDLFMRMNPLAPEVKFRYLRGGFEIVGDHPRAWEARKLIDYYKDLVSEVKLEAKIDGDFKVGTEEPFGVYVNLRHTKEIERESDGFSKYVQNQNSRSGYYNYGRPTEDYRKKFTESVTEALDEHFDIKGITFQDGKTMSSQPGKDIYRVTPYAYLLLQARGSEVDRLASLKLDMDFLDTSGYVVIPIESPEVVLDATRSEGIRPVSGLKLTQTLDERLADEGKLIVEIKATANGLVPKLDEILELEMANFEVASIDDQGVLPVSFTEQRGRSRISSERSWSVEYQAKETQAESIDFSFSDAKLDDVDLTWQRYDDVDLVEAEQTVSLEQSYAKVDSTFPWWIIPAVGVLLVGLLGLVYVLSRPKVVKEDKFTMPEEINPFTVLTLLRDIRQRNGIANEKLIELEQSIAEVEHNSFSRESRELENLEELARTWLNRSS